MLGSAQRDGQAYDFVFADLWMPNLNGIELVEKLRADSHFRRLPVYAVTADVEFLRDDRNRHFTGILLKPLSYGKLMEAIAKAMRGQGVGRDDECRSQREYPARQ